MAIPSTPDLGSYVGLPWLPLGRSRAGVDCYGLLTLVYKEIAAVALPSHADGYLTPEDREAVTGLIQGSLGPWIEVPAGRERALDGVLMTEAGVPRHIGIVVCPGRLLHIENGETAVIESYAGWRLKRRIAGFYRHRRFA